MQNSEWQYAINITYKFCMNISFAYIACICIASLAYKFFMNMKSGNPYICCYDIKVAAMFKCLVWSNISSGLFGNFLIVIDLKFLRTKFSTDRTWCLS